MLFLKLIIAGIELHNQTARFHVLAFFAFQRNDFAAMFALHVGFRERGDRAVKRLRNLDILLRHARHFDRLALIRLNFLDALRFGRSLFRRFTIRCK